MYTHAAIQFTDPFAATRSSSGPYPSAHGLRRGDQELVLKRVPGDFNRALTPPPDMHGNYYASTAALPRHEQVRNVEEASYHQAGYRAHAAHAPCEQYNGSAALSSQIIGTRGHTMSPAPSRLSRHQPGNTAYECESQSRRPSQSIATSFQIPRSVNSSGGSLAELAAQITCLFWFESSDLLQRIEHSPDALSPPWKLAKDAIPTTGFRKWVTTILSTTLVAQNVVLLALLFVHRLKKLNPSVRGKPGSEYRLLTVALMLGNKFLDDNTYTNKTWAEVSGINVGEVHIMEVEFLSNMKYWLLTSAEDWAEWQTLLGKYSNFFDRATHPVHSRQQPAPILPPASSQHLPMALPSPPTSNYASPPFGADLAHGSIQQSAASALGTTPAPSPSPLKPIMAGTLPNQRKRSRDDHGGEPPMKRAASGVHDMNQAFPSNNAPYPRFTLPSLAMTPNGSLSTPQSNQLPPLNVPARSMALALQGSAPQPHTHAGATTLPPIDSHIPYFQQASRQQSPYSRSAATSPTSVIPGSAAILPPITSVSPLSYLRQRDSPYRPVHNVSTLLYPPPSSALQRRPQNIEFNQMRYQPLSKSTQEDQTGHLPYVAQNVWLHGNQQQAMTPVHQWPGFQAH